MLYLPKSSKSSRALYLSVCKADLMSGWHMQSACTCCCSALRPRLITHVGSSSCSPRTMRSSNQVSATNYQSGMMRYPFVRRGCNLLSEGERRARARGGRWRHGMRKMDGLSRLRMWLVWACSTGGGNGQHDLQTSPPNAAVHQTGNHGNASERGHLVVRGSCGSRPERKTVVLPPEHET